MILAITQARVSSSRLPQKVLKKLGDKTVLGLHLERLKKSRKINKLVVATTFEKDIEPLLGIVRDSGVDFVQGSLDDVLDRFYQTAKKYSPDYVVRLTSDCPLIDPKLLDEMIEKFLKSGADYGSNCFKPTYPDGFDAEIFSFKVLEKAWKEATLKSDREHVTTYIRKHSIDKIFSLENSENYSQYRLTLDNEEDYQLLQTLVRTIGTDKDWKTYTDYLIKHPELTKVNEHIKRNEGLTKSLNEDSK